ncbi:MAG: hypothetical protein EHM41_16405 [Chloroflexi bacterium]|nr:MAG: hypothetical protein EHM41_16405 [Chloroflexota bacterium]
MARGPTAPEGFEACLRSRWASGYGLLVAWLCSGILSGVAVKIDAAAMVDQALKGEFVTNPVKDAARRLLRRRNR